MTSRIALVANAVHQLFSAGADAEDVSQEGLAKLLRQLDGVTAKDVELSEQLVQEASGPQAPVAYAHMANNGVFSMGLYALGPGAGIPLHDHPGMFGFRKLLRGAVRCRAFSRCRQRRQLPALAAALRSWQLEALDELVPASLAFDTVLTPASRPTLLTPTDANFQELRALGEGAVLLDILAPPYDHDLGRRVRRYYRELALPPGAQLCLLEVPQPPDFVCCSAEYTGPRVT